MFRDQKEASWALAKIRTSIFSRSKAPHISSTGDWTKNIYTDLPLPLAPLTGMICCIYSSSWSSSALMDRGPFLTINVMTSYSVSAAAMVVSSAFVSYAGATSTMSQAMKLMPSRPRMMVLSSRVDQPPVSGVPVAGATE